MIHHVSKCQYQFGLIGRSLEHSYSYKHFNEKFVQLNIQRTHEYHNFELADPEDVRHFMRATSCIGCNVTIPYKRVVASNCDVRIGYAAKLGVVNTIAKVNGRWLGWNTDVHGFIKSLHEAFIDLNEVKRSAKGTAIVLGSGGASAAVVEALQAMGMKTMVASRTPDEGQLGYDRLENQGFEEYEVIVNCTPVGMYPDIDQMLPLNLTSLTSYHTVVDLIYNPSKSLLLKTAEEYGARIINGTSMLFHQAELSWSIWNQSLGHYV